MLPNHLAILILNHFILGSLVFIALAIAIAKYAIYRQHQPHNWQTVLLLKIFSIIVLFTPIWCLANANQIGRKTVTTTISATYLHPANSTVQLGTKRSPQKYVFDINHHSMYLSDLNLPEQSTDKLAEFRNQACRLTITTQVIKPQLTARWMLNTTKPTNTTISAVKLQRTIAHPVVETPNQHALSQLIIETNYR